MSDSVIADWPKALTDLLGDSTTCSLATIDNNGAPHAANVNFAFDSTADVYFLSAPHSQHIQHIATNPTVAATAYAPFARASEIRGVQLHGTVQPVDNATLPIEQLWQLLTERFPDIADMEARARSQQFYRLRPTWVRLIDNRNGFGWKAETAWPPPAIA
jgi:uncharacterized protein YhbP (UPF0306 family)